jgi:hypothetical protein
MGNKVKLQGKVDCWEQREAVESAAWSVAGVQSIDDRLTIVRRVSASSIFLLMSDVVTAGLSEMLLITPMTPDNFRTASSAAFF